MKKANVIFIALIVLDLVIASYIYYDTFELNPQCKSAYAFKPSFLRPFPPADYVRP